MGVRAKPWELAVPQPAQVLSVPTLTLLWTVGGLSCSPSWITWTTQLCRQHSTCPFLPSVVLPSWVPSLSKMWKKLAWTLEFPYLSFFLFSFYGESWVPRPPNNIWSRLGIMSLKDWIIQFKKGAHLWNRDIHLTYLYVINTYMGHRGPSICHASYSLHQQAFVYIYAPSILFFSL